MIFNKRDALFENYRQLVEGLSEAVIGLKAGPRTAAFEALYKESVREGNSDTPYCTKPGTAALTAKARPDANFAEVSNC